MRTVIERYYDQYYSIDLNEKQEEDQYVNRHSNGLCIVGLAPTHPALSKEIQKIEYAGDLINNTVQGSQKKGGYNLKKETVLAYITCTDGSQYAIRSCIKGKLLETNKLMIADYSILKTKAATSGFIAIIDPVNREDFLKLNPEMITFNAYHEKRGIAITKGPTFQKDTTIDEDEEQQQQQQQR
eukprot:gene14992-17728_t